MRHRTQTQEDGFSLVELLISILILSVIAASTTGVVMSMLRAEQYQATLETVTNDGRISLERIRKELREARRVLPDSCQDPATSCVPSAQLHFWVDRDQNNLMSAPELVCYVTKPAAAGGYRLHRFTGATGLCRADEPLPSGAQILAQTLVEATPFTAMDPAPTLDPTDPETRTVEVTLRLMVPNDTRGPGMLEFRDRVRLRNVA